MGFSSFLDHVYGQIRCLRRRPRFIGFSIGVKITPISRLLFTLEHGSSEGSLSILPFVTSDKDVLCPVRLNK